jgi:hypothetical protein
MADAWDVGGNFETVRQTNAANLTESGVRLLRSRGVNAGADTSALRAALQRWRLRLPGFVVAALTDQLIDRRHELQFYLSDKNPEDNANKTILDALLTACITDAEERTESFSRTAPIEDWAGSEQISRGGPERKA